MPIHFNQPAYYSPDYALALNATLEAIELEFSEPAELSERALEVIEYTFSYDPIYLSRIRENPNILRQEIAGTFEDLIVFGNPEILAWCLGDALRCSIELKDSKTTLADDGYFGNLLLYYILRFSNDQTALSDESAYIYYGKKFTYLRTPQLQVANATALLVNYMFTKRIEPCCNSFLDYLPMYPSLVKPFLQLKESSELG